MTNMSGDMVKTSVTDLCTLPKLGRVHQFWIRPCLKVEEIDGYDVTQQSC